ncbi:glycoside hydrolase family 16 protein [Motilibacter sp. E257]|uniref:Glycoside hydrolase family 16 protein n=1 Tax=Motilibacter deserti TaxID=2714956 RepID=A0ABX0GWX1_9ACTN|nr:glycoside hydrolase family 16 protein [Motilibacter deserti]
MVFAEEFDAPRLDRSRWLPHYLPEWSSRATSAATYEVQDSCLRLSIPADQGLWCADEHSPPLRVSGVQSASLSGPVGSTRGQQPFRPGLTVKQEQPEFRGWTPSSGYLEMRARADITPRSMVAWWLVGLEDVPARSAEICVAEVFGDAVVPGSGAGVGCGLHSFRDPHVPEDFAVTQLPIDVADFHTYAVDWTSDRVEFLVDGVAVRACAAPPTYPMQLMLAVFDFPDRSDGHDAGAVPQLVVDYVRGYA